MKLELAYIIIFVLPFTIKAPEFALTDDLNEPLLKFNSLTQGNNRNRSWNYNIFAIRRSPKLTLFYLIHLLNNKSTQVKMTTREMHFQITGDKINLFPYVRVFSQVASTDR